LFGQRPPRLKPRLFITVAGWLALFSWLLNVVPGGLEPGLLLGGEPGEAGLLGPGLVREAGETGVLGQADRLVDVVGVLEMGVHHVPMCVSLYVPVDVRLTAGSINGDELLVAQLERPRARVEP